jgi:cytochrome P450
VTPQQTQIRRENGGPSPKAVDAVGPRIPIYTEEFAADPHGVYRRMRAEYKSSLVPVWIAPDVPATLVIGHSAAVRILHDPAHFPADPRRWQKTVPADLAVMPMMQWRPNALRSDGGSVEHKRYRRATTEALAGVNMHEVRKTVERTAGSLVLTICGDGQADLIGDYAAKLTFTVLNHILGCPSDIGAHIAEASRELFESQDTAQVNAKLNRALTDLTRLKRREPGDDVATRLVRHPAGLTDLEMVHQLVTLYSAGVEVPTNLIGNTLLLMLTDPRFRGRGDLGDNADGIAPLPTEQAINEILAGDPPMANYCITYPLQPIAVEGVWLPPDQPVITSMAGCSSSPEVNNGDHATNGWSLAWGLGEHQCPHAARTLSQLIVHDAIDHVLDLLDNLELAVPDTELVWRPGPFHRAPAALPVAFTPGLPAGLFPTQRPADGRPTPRIRSRVARRSDV